MRYLYLVFGLLCGSSTFAQFSNSATFIMPDVSADNGTEVCVPISADNFSSGIEFSFALQWDKPEDGGALTYTRVTSFGIPFLDQADFDESYVNDGLLTVSWGNFPNGSTCEDRTGELTIPNGATIFEICFTVSGPISSNHPIRFFDKPDDDPFDGVDDSVDISFLKGFQCISRTNTNPETEPGSVTVGVSPLQLAFGEVTGEFTPGDTYCLDLLIESGFTQIKGFQYGVFFDPTVLRAIEATANRDLPGHDDLDYNLFLNIGAGGEAVYASWNAIPDTPYDLANGTRLATICFEVIGDCNEATAIRIGEGITPDGVDRPIDANGDGIALASLPVITTGTTLQIGNCNSEGFDVVFDCPDTPVNFGDTEVCVDVRAGDDFVDMVDIRYLISFDPEILEFASIGDRAGSLFINPSSDYDFDQIDDGILIFDWDSPNPKTLDEGELVFQICFNAVGFGGTSPIVAARFRGDPESSTQGFFSGVNPSNCAITVQQPDGVALNFPDLGYTSTQDNCFPLEVTGFTDVNSFTLFVLAPNALFDFTGFTPGVSGVTATEISAGLIQLNYDGPAFTLPEGGSLGEFCFRAQDDAAPGDCGVIGSSEIIPSRVTTTESEGNSVRVESFNGEACVLFPNGFGMVVQNTEGFINDQICVPVSVTRFQGIVNFSTTFVFDPTLLSYSAVNLAASPLTGITAGDFDVSNTAAGRLTLNWSSGSPAGLDLATTDTVQVFEICFDAGANDECTDLEVRDGGTPPVTTTEGPGSIIFGNGEVCLQDRLVLLSIMADDASCNDTDDGSIRYETAPRPNGEDIFIRVVGPNGRVRYGSLGLVEGLLPGLNSYVLYNSGSGVRQEGTIEVGINPDNVAIAQFDDTNPQLSCGDDPVALIGGRDNSGATYRLFVVTPQMTTRLVFSGDVASDGNVTELVRESGDYILEVTSTAGCSARDTINVAPPTNPIAVAGDDTAITCNPGGTVLSGAGSSTDNNAVYLWERVALDGTPLDTVGTTLFVEVTEPGRYNLTVTYPVQMCSATDQVIVSDRNALPMSDLPTVVALDCDGGPVTLNIGSPEENVTYNWTRLNSATSISQDTSFTTDELGFYVATLENTVTGCTRIDTVEVVPSTGAPVINVADQEIFMPCKPDTLQIDMIDYDNVNQDTRYRWTSEDGRVVITDVTLARPRVVIPGLYKVIVTAGACRDSAFVEVKPSLFPVAEAGEEGRLSCTEDFQLSGSGSILNGDDLSYQWVFNGQPVPMGSAPTVTVGEPGTYTLEVTSENGGCTSTDSVLLRQPNGFPGYSLLDTVTGLGCAPTMVSFGLEGAGAEDYVVSWTDPNGAEIGTDYSVMTGVAGLHRLVISNPATGCTREDSVMVIADAANLPVVAFRQNTLELSCENGPVWIDGAPSSQGDNFTYTWEAVTDGEEPNTQGNDSLRVRTAGTYRLTVVNTETNCVNSREVTVTDSREFPEVNPVEGMQLNCDTRETVIGIDIVDQPNDFTIQWSGPAGVSGLPNDTTRLLVTTGGSYNAVVINPTTSCVTTVSIRVEDLVDSIGTLAIMMPDSFDCNNTTITIDASGSDLNGTPQENISWTSFNGNNINPATGSLIVSVDGPGDYELAITDGSGCTIRDTVRVEAATDTPFAQAGPPQEVECGDMPQLDGSASTPAPGPGILYEWTASDGGAIIEGNENSSTPFVSGAGTYQLVISNLNNGCADSSTTVVTLSTAVAADGGTDFTTCEPTAMLTGNLPEGTSGVWTAFNDEGSVWSATDNIATVTEIADGLSLVWTLSAGMGCENYSADTVRVAPEDAPVAANDVIEVGGSNPVGTVDLLQNDQRTGPVTVTLLGQPAFGEILANLNGMITFEAPQGLTDETIIEYEVCSTTCPDLCSRATLTIFANADGTDPTVYNAISPNGDNMNDVFYFEKLGRNPADFPDSELVIFNRWGDIIYEAKPYNNDWDGTSNGGTEVPEGTYYYVLRLNVGEGDIIRGDVTVIR